MLAMKMKVKTNNTNYTISHMGGRIWMKCVRKITVLLNDINMCLALNPIFVNHTAKFRFFLLTFVNFWILVT